MQPLNQTFYEKDTLTVAKQLLGKVLIRKTASMVFRGIITETEAYTEDDPASHSYLGKKTKRNLPMFGLPGSLYVYFIYGMYHCMNIVTEKKGVGAAVLIRGLMPLVADGELSKDIKNKWNGPGRICRQLDINLTFNNQFVCIENSPIIVAASNYKPDKIIASERVGISKAQSLQRRFLCYHFSK